jgi:SIR2-like domain
MSVSSATPSQTPVYPEPPYKFILDRLQKGKVIPFLGAGASLVGRTASAGWSAPDADFLPGATELSTYLVDKIGYPASDLELTRVAQYFDVVGGPAGLGDELHEIFAKPYACGDLHDFLAGLPCPVIVTTNYDDLIEDAFRKRGRPFHRVVYRTGQTTFFVWEYGQGAPKEVHPNEMDLALGEVPVIFKMHGAADTADKDRDSYVITEDNYVEFLARIGQQSAIPAVIAECFRASHFLFLGYGLKDWNLRVILHEIWRKWPRKHGSWAIQHKPAQLEYQFWLKRDLNIYEVSIDDFLAKLRGGGA